MSLKKKIVTSFLISAGIIAFLAAFEYVNFTEIKKEIRSLELTDTIRSKSLQLRRHEKNFFLYGPLSEESKAIYRYLDELDEAMRVSVATDKTGKLFELKERVTAYRQRFGRIDARVKDLGEEFKKLRPAYDRYRFFPLLELTFLDRPLQTAEFLEGLPPSEGPLISGLRELDLEINALRKNGEDILVISKELDRTARENSERAIHISQIAILTVFPLFLVVGIGTLFVISSSVALRLKKLADVVEKTGRGDFSAFIPLEVFSRNDEIDVLIRKFNDMEGQLAQHAEELGRKNRELLQSKKLAAIGTLASGVAHELNNPLNNIYISAQVLMKETGEDSPPLVKEVVGDIVSQTARVKRIVGDLLEFARGREPRFGDVELNGMISDAFFRNIGSSVNIDRVKFVLDADPGGVTVRADRGQLEQVFTNLFTNAIEAMAGAGELKVLVQKGRDAVTIRVSDTGKGISAEDAEKVFEPFYTTKDKGTGLGLAIVFNIVKKHNGDIRVESGEGKGAVFIITLPAGEERHGV